MGKRTYEKTDNDLENGEDLKHLVNDKRRGWRASPSKARRRQRRYENRIVKCLLSEHFSFNGYGVIVKNEMIKK